MKTHHILNIGGLCLLFLFPLNVLAKNNLKNDTLTVITQNELKTFAVKTEIISIKDELYKLIIYNTVVHTDKNAITVPCDSLFISVFEPSPIAAGLKILKQNREETFPENFNLDTLSSNICAAFYKKRHSEKYPLWINDIEGIDIANKDLAVELKSNLADLWEIKGGMKEILKSESRLFSDEFLKQRKLIRGKQRILNNLRRQLPASIEISGLASLNPSAINSVQNQVTSGIQIRVIKAYFNDFTASINLVETADSIEGKYNEPIFGRSVLSPGNRKYSIMTSYRFYSLFPNSRSRFFNNTGFVWNINTALLKWRLNKDVTVLADSITMDSTTSTVFDKEINVIPFAMDLLGSHTFFRKYNEKDHTNIAVSTDLGISLRYIGGDTDKNILTDYIGSGKIFYTGIVMGININYNNIRIQFQGLVFPKDRSSAAVAGFTNGQLSGNISIIGTLIKN